MNRRRFVTTSGTLAAGVLLPLAAAAQPQRGVIHELRGRVLLNGQPLARNTAIQPGQSITTGADGHIWFTLGGDAFFLRPGSELRLSASLRDTVVEALRLVSGALGATFRPGARRTVVAETVTIGIRGTGIYVETSRDATYACTCFGAAELASSADQGLIRARHHAARWIRRADPRILPGGMDNHTDEEISRLERLAGRPNPF